MSRTLQVVYQLERMSHHADAVLSPGSLYIHCRITEIYKTILIVSFKNYKLNLTVWLFWSKGNGSSVEILSRVCFKNSI